MTFQLNFDFWPNKMKVLVVFTAFIGLALGNGDIFVGKWKEDQYQRENFGDYLYQRGLNWFKRVYATSASFELTMNVVKEGNTFTIGGQSKFIIQIIGVLWSIILQPYFEQFTAIYRFQIDRQKISSGSNFSTVLWNFIKWNVPFFNFSPNHL